jgi:hypothetical protein
VKPRAVTRDNTRCPQPHLPLRPVLARSVALLTSALDRSIYALYRITGRATLVLESFGISFRLCYLIHIHTTL